MNPAMNPTVNNQIADLAADLRRQAALFDGNQGDHVHGMRAGLLLAAVQVQHLANTAPASHNSDNGMPSPWMRRNLGKVAS